MKLEKSFAALVAGMGLVVSMGAQAQSVPPPGQVTVSNVIWGGSGCTQENASVQVTPDKTQFTVLFDSYVAEKVAGGTPLVRQNCTVQAILNVPSGYSYSLVSVEYSGYYYLESGVSAVQKSEYKFVDPTVSFNPTATFQSTFNGPADESYFYTDRIGVIGNVWSPCKVLRPLRIATELRVTGPKTKYGYISLDQLSGGIDTKYHHSYYIQWKKC